MTWIGLLFTLAAGQDPGLDTLLDRLGDEALEVREAAESRLRSMTRDIVPALQRAAGTARDPERRERILSVVRHFTKVRWFSDLATARQQAAATRKPLLVFSTMGPLNGYVCLGGHLMRSVTFADPRVVDAVNDAFVAVWNNHNSERVTTGFQAAYRTEEIAAYPEGGGGNNLHTVISTPDGTVLQDLSGYWSPEVFLKELEFARGLTPQTASARHGARAQALMAQADRLLAEHPEARGRRVRESPVLRQHAALALLAAGHQEHSGAPQDVGKLLHQFAENSRVRVFA